MIYSEQNITYVHSYMLVCYQFCNGKGYLCSQLYARLLSIPQREGVAKDLKLCDKA